MYTGKQRGATGESFRVACHLWPPLQKVHRARAIMVPVGPWTICVLCIAVACSVCSPCSVYTGDRGPTGGIWVVGTPATAAQLVHRSRFGWKMNLDASIERRSLDHAISRKLGYTTGKMRRTHIADTNTEISNSCGCNHDHMERLLFPG